MPSGKGNDCTRAILLAGLLVLPGAAAEPVSHHAEARGDAEVARSPSHDWETMATRTLAELPEIPLDAPGNRFGGYPRRFAEPTGFFRTVKSGDRWWLVDPDGHLFIHRGVTSVRPVRASAAAEVLRERFGSKEAWATSACGLIKEHGFNGLGAWCDDATIGNARHPLVYTRLWNFMSAYGKVRGGTYTKPGHTGYPGDCPFIFDPEFPAFCDRHARRLADTKDDPWLLGHYTDNELPWSTRMLSRYLRLPESDPGHQAARRWLEERHGKGAGRSSITQQDREDFVAFAADTYFGIVCAAIRKYDPNHLVLGSRFHGRAVRIPSLFAAAGQHLDVVSVNYYHAWSPDPDLMASWSSRSGKPVIITEFYAKALDSGLANTSGAGWLVKSQADRAAFYQNFTLGLLESGNCVGWHWFRYSDNDPEEKGVDPSNRDANKGIVSNRYQPYETLLAAMEEINTRTFGIIRHFDQLDRSP